MVEMVKFFLKEEWKGKYAVIGACLYIFTAVLITFLAMPGMDKPHFAAVFWIVVIFTTLQGISKSFIQMRRSNFVFWHQICSAQVFLAAKLVCSAILMCFFTLFAWLVFSMMHGNPGNGSGLFLIVCLITGICIATIFTISSSIAAKTDNPGVLLPVLTFPVIIPLVLVGAKAGKKAIDAVSISSLLPDISVLLVFNILTIAMGLVLIKFVWKD